MSKVYVGDTGAGLRPGHQHRHRPHDRSAQAERRHGQLVGDWRLQARVVTLAGAWRGEAVTLTAHPNFA